MMSKYFLVGFCTCLFFVSSMLQASYIEDTLTFKNIAYWSNSPTDISSISTGTISKTGKYSCKLSYQFVVPDNYGSGNETINVFPNNAITLDSTTKYIGVWIYGDGSPHRLYFSFQDAHGENLLDISSESSSVYRDVNFVGWKYVEISLENDSFIAWGGTVQNGEVDYPVQFKGFVLDDMGTGVGSGEITFDQFHLLSTSKINEWSNDAVAEVLTFENLSRWVSSPAETTSIASGDKKVTGQCGCKLLYQFTIPGNYDSGNETVSVVPQIPIMIDSDIKYIGVWVYGDGSPHRLYFKFKDVDGEYLTDVSSEGPSVYRDIDFYGWKYIEISLENDYFLGWNGTVQNNHVDYPVQFLGFVLDDMGTGIGSGELILDQFLLLSSSKKEEWSNAGLMSLKNLDNWSNSPIETSTISPGAKSKTGKYSCNLSYQFTVPGNTDAGNETINVVPKYPVVLYSDIKYIGVWVYGDGTPHRLYFQFQDIYGEYLTDISSESTSVYRDVNFTGWKYIEVSLENDYFLSWGGTVQNNQIDYPVQFKGFTLDDMGTGVGSGGIIFDQFHLLTTSMMNEWSETAIAETLTFQNLTRWDCSPDDIAVITPGDKLKTGLYSCKLSYQFIKPGNAGEGNETVSVVPQIPIMIDSDTKYIGVWVYGDGSPHRLYFKFKDVDGEYLTDVSSEGPQLYRTVNFYGWKYIEISLENDYYLGWGGTVQNNQLNYPAQFLGFVLDDMGEGFGRGELIFDQFHLLTISKKDEWTSEPVDPPVDQIDIPVTIQSNHIGNLSFDNSDINFTINVSSGESSLLADRVIRVTDFFNRLVDIRVDPINVSSSNTSITYTLSSSNKGFYKVSCSIEAGGQVVSSQETTCAIIDPVNVANPSQSPFGIYYWFIGDPQYDLSIISKMGFRWVRFDMRWDEIEKTPGVYTWGVYDNRISTGQAYDLQLVPGIYYVPEWAAAEVKNLYGGDPDDYNDYANICSLAATRYPYVKYWELWNEPDTAAHWSGGPAEYAELLSKGYNAIKSANPNAKVLFGGVTGLEELWYPFVTNCISAGGGNFFDIYDYHYGAGADRAPNFIMGEHHRDLLSNAGLDKEIWNTEESSWPVKTLKYAVLSISEGVDKFFFFLFRITAGVESETTLVNDDYSPRFNFITMHTFLKALNGLTISHDFSDTDIKSFLFTDSVNSQIVAWSENLPCYSLLVDGNTINVTDYTGEKYELHCIDGKASIPLDQIAYIDSDSVSFGPAMIYFSERDVVYYPDQNKTVGITLHNPSSQTLTFTVNTEVSSSWNKGTDSQTVSMAPGSTTEIAVPLHAPTNSDYQEYRISAELIVNGFLCGYDRIQTRIVPPVELACVPTLVGSIKTVNITVKNYRDSAISANLKIELPVGWLADETMSITIPANGTQVIQKSVPATAIVGPDTNYPVVLKFTAPTENIEIQEQFMTSWILCPTIITPVVIDGVLSDWEEYSLSERVLDSPAEYTAASTILFPWTGASDLSVKANFRCDSQFFYFMSRVTDDYHCQSQINGDAWHEDSLQLMIGNDIYDLALGDNGPMLFCNNSAIDLSGFDYAVVRMGQDTCYEIAVPRSILDLQNNCLKFSFIVNDSDGDLWREGWMYWISDIGTVPEQDKIQTIILESN